MGGGKGGGSSGPKKLSTRCDSSLNTIKTPGTIEYNSTERPVGVAFHNGRVFYFGLDIFGQPAVYFSQLLTDTSKAGLCYQDADPTAEEINDLVATDGGVLRPVGMGTPIAAMESDFGVLCFCSNGVWIIRGPEGSGFTATNFNVGKVTDKGCLGKQSIVDVSGAIIYFHEDAIIQLAPDEFGRIQATDLTNDSIKSLYLGFTSRDRSNAKGCYIESEKRAYWVIPTAQANGTYKHDARNVLVLATDLPGFYQWSLPATTANNVLLLPFEDRTKTEVVALETLTTTDGITAVTLVDGSTLVTSEVRFVEEGDTLPLFMTSRQSSTTFPVEFYHPTSNSFSDFGGQDYTSFVEFGYQYASSKATGLSAPYIHSFFKRGRGAPPRPELYCESTDTWMKLTNISNTLVTGLDNKYEDITGAPAISSDGRWLFVVYYTNDTLNRELVKFELTTPFDVDTAVITSDFVQLPEDTSTNSLQKLFINSDGTVLWLLPWASYAGTKAIQVNFNTPYEIATATVTNISLYPLTFTTPTTVTGELWAVEVPPTGDRLWVMYRNTAADGFLMGEVGLTTPWDLTTAQTGSVSRVAVDYTAFDVPAHTPYTFCFSYSGNRVHILLKGGQRFDASYHVILEAPLTEAYNLNTIGAFKELGVTSSINFPNDPVIHRPWRACTIQIWAWCMDTILGNDGYNLTGGSYHVEYVLDEFTNLVARANTTAYSVIPGTSEEAGVIATYAGVVASQGRGFKSLLDSPYTTYGSPGIMAAGASSFIEGVLLRGPADTTGDALHTTAVGATSSYHGYGISYGYMEPDSDYGFIYKTSRWTGAPDSVILRVSDAYTGDVLLSKQLWKAVVDEDALGWTFTSVYYTEIYGSPQVFVSPTAFKNAVPSTNPGRFATFNDRDFDNPTEDLLLPYRGRTVIVDILEAS